MVSLINEFYKEVPFDSSFEGKNELEDSIRKFFQGNSLEEQQEAGKKVWENLRPRIAELQAQKETNSQNQTIDNQSKQSPSTDDTGLR